MLGIQRQVHIVHTTLNVKLQEELERLLRDVFGAETYYKDYSEELDRDAALVLIGEMCIEPLSKRFNLEAVGSAKWIKTNGQRFHSVAFKIEDVRQADAHLAKHGLKRYYTNPEYRNVFFLTELERVLNQFGNRGYRAAQLEAGIIGGKLYLAAYAQRLGASGLTFYDDAVTEFFSPHAHGKSVMFLVALGRSAKRKRT